MNFAVENGHKKNAYIHGADSSITRTRLITLNKRLEEYGIIVPDEYIQKSPYRNTHGAYEKTLELLELPNYPHVSFAQMIMLHTVRIELYLKREEKFQRIYRLLDLI